MLCLISGVQAVKREEEDSKEKEEEGSRGKD